jgi:hypothetical protein
MAPNRESNAFLTLLLITLYMVGLGGFEPPTSPLSGVRSNQLSYRPMVGTPEIKQFVVDARAVT